MRISTGICLIVFVQFIATCNQKAEPETYLIPENFTGKVNILFHSVNAAAEEYEGRRRIYRIPPGGVLRTRFKTNDGFTDRQYYYVDNAGNRMRLPVFKYSHNPDGTIKWMVTDKNETGIFLDGTSGQYGNTTDSTSAQYQEFIVSSYSQLDSFYTEEYRDKFNRQVEMTREGAHALK